MAEHLRLGKIDPGQRVQRIGVGRRDATVVGRRDNAARWRIAPSAPAGLPSLATLVICTRVTSVVIKRVAVDVGVFAICLLP